MIKHGLIFTTLLCAACTSTNPLPKPISNGAIAIEDAGGFICEAESAQSLLGQKASVELGQEAMKLSGATILRWIPPRTPVTRDYRNNRLNINYDDMLIITQIYCG